jgi:hypothetical protein
MHVPASLIRSLENGAGRIEGMKVKDGGKMCCTGYRREKESGKHITSFRG